MIHPTIIEAKLSDGSSIYSVKFGNIELHAVDNKEAMIIWQKLTDACSLALNVTIHTGN